MQRTEVEKAAQILGLELTDDLTADEVNAAWRNAAKNAHPDAGGVEEGAAYLIERARDARGLLLAWLRGQGNPKCPLCKGTMYIPNGGFGVRPCTRCI